MDLTAFIEPATKEILGYGVLGVAVLALTALYIMERRDRRDAEKAVDTFRDAAAAKIDEIQNSRVEDMRSSIDAVRKGDEVMSEMQSTFERKMDGLKTSIDTLTASIARGR